MESAIFTQALREFLRLRRVVPWVLFSLICGALAFIWPKFQPDVTHQGQYVNVIAIFVFRMVALASAILTTAIVSQEVEQKTIVYLLTRPVKRSSIILFRYLASVIVMGGISIFGLLCTSFGAHLGFSNELLTKDILAVVLGSAAYGAFFLFISLILNRSMLVCLLYAFAWESAIPNLPGDLYYLSINSYIQGIAQHPASEDANRTVTVAGGMKSTALLSSTTSIAVLILLSVTLVVISMVWFTKFEFVPREDAE